eukprot:TRINITY_DN812_c1_g1_i10.p1 TRINITY_DN812_c1_g1~~TRINITY_DN812_c1_g1_i10.p1  ORF type:complete len:860 (-),score=272.77 TRINITY_DN812_c1_g1_i10:74-2632(-)
MDSVQKSDVEGNRLVVGIDFGSADSYVGYISKGSVDIVQNEVSQRKTPSLVGFTERERLLGDAALSQIKSNTKNTCRNFKHLLGHKLHSPEVEKEHFWATSAVEEAPGGSCGFGVSYKGEKQIFSAVEITAMFFTKLIAITEAWCQGTLADCVIAVPSYFADAQRQALLDAAHIAGLNVLRVMNEHAATALAYGIYRTADFDVDKPQTVAFCTMGHVVFSVAIVQFVRGKLTVVCEKSAKVGGRDMDECLMRSFAAQFQKKVGCDPLSNKKASFKLEDAVMKTKKILSANSEASVSVECLMEDEDFSSNMKREDFLEMCKPMMKKVSDVLEAAKAMCGLPMSAIDAVEMCGGASRVPWVKEMCSKAFGDKALSTTMNADESVARGCALQAAILSPLYKVRDFTVCDTTPHSVSIGWMGSAADAEAVKGEDDDEQMAGGEGEYKTATVFPANSAMNTLKLMTFYRNGPFDIKMEYADTTNLVPGVDALLGNFKIDLAPSAEAKRVKVKAKLSGNGTFGIEGAQLVEEEEVEEVVKEKKEIEVPAEEEKPAEDEGAKPEDDGAEKKDGEEQKKDGEEEKKEEAKKEPEKKYEWVEVKKMKKRTKRTDLKVIASGTPGLSEGTIAKRTDEETAMQVEMNEIIETDARRNDLESYIFTMRDKTSESGDYGAFISQADREQFHADLMKAEDWLYDTYDATKVQYVEKLDDLKKIGDPVVFRFKEDETRAEWINAVKGTIANYSNAAKNPGDQYGHIAAEKLASIVKECDDVSAWLTGLQEQQAAMPKHEKPVLLCFDMEKKNQELAKLADAILKEPKPQPAAPPAEEKKEAEEEPKKEEGDAPQEEEKQGGDVADVD